MATRNVSGSQVRQSMATSGSAVKTRQLVSSLNPYYITMVVINQLLYRVTLRTRVA
ncbi:hypothetical protein IWW34DRAFT_728245 [Fusarium oxysporum f. sp. albedinis]|nr:hypothetical protein IWW34DRAFT_728245 [Fusarium oxysporum f. sp. albedinis]